MNMQGTCKTFLRMSEGESLTFWKRFCEYRFFKSYAIDVRFGYCTVARQVKT